MTKVVWIDRKPRKGVNGDRAVTEIPYYDYTIHMVDGDGFPTSDNHIHQISGYDYFNSHVLGLDRVEQEAVRYAERLARLTDTGEIHRAWEEGRVNHTAMVTISVRAGDREEALAKVREVFDATQEIFKGAGMTATQVILAED